MLIVYRNSMFSLKIQIEEATNYSHDVTFEQNNMNAKLEFMNTFHYPWYSKI